MRLRELIGQWLIDALRMSQAEPDLTPSWARNLRLRRPDRNSRLRLANTNSRLRPPDEVIAAILFGSIFLLVMFVVIPNVLVLRP